MQPPAPMEGLAYYTQSLLALWPEKAVIGSCVAGVVSLFGGDAYLLWMLGAMLVADFAFGLADAVRRRHFRCRMLAHGALKFPAYCLYLLIVGVVNASLSRSFGGFDMPLLNLFIAYLIITDAVSVIAHMQRLGIPVPDLLRRVLLRSKRKVERRVDEAVGGDTRKRRKRGRGSGRPSRTASGRAHIGAGTVRGGGSCGRRSLWMNRCAGSAARPGASCRRRTLTTLWPEPTAGRTTGATCNPSAMPATAARPSGRTAGVR